MSFIGLSGGGFLPGGKLISQGVPGRLGAHPEPPADLEAVHLDDGAVHVERKGLASFEQGQVVVDYFLQVSCFSKGAQGFDPHAA